MTLLVWDDVLAIRRWALPADDDDEETLPEFRVLPDGSVEPWQDAPNAEERPDAKDSRDDFSPSLN